MKTLINSLLLTLFSICLIAACDITESNPELLEEQSLNLTEMKHGNNIQSLKKNMGFRERYLISGYVRTEDNRPVPNFKVIAFDRKVGEETSLGESMTKNGIYKIDYTEKATELLQNQNADLFVQGYNSDGKVIARSDLVVNAPKNVRINLTVPNETYRGPSEFEELNTAIKILVELNPDVKKDFEDKDIKYIAAKLKLALPKVERFVHAWELMWDAGRYKEGYNIPAEAFYGIINDNDLPELESLVNQNKKILKQSLEQAVVSNIIPIKLKEQIDTLVDALKEIADDNVVRRYQLIH